MPAMTTNTQVNLLIDLLGYSSLYPPQQLALSKGILEKRNLLIATPTASGKTLIAEMASIKALELGLKVVYLTPLRSLSTEKYNEFQIFKKLDVGRKIRIKLANSDYDSTEKETKSADIIVLTNEKLDSFMRRGVKWISEVGLFVVDEVHLIGDRERGPTLEMMLTKIRKLYPLSQILALSATVVNAKEIADWLECDLIKSNWRPTKLIEGIYENGYVYMNDGTHFQLKPFTDVSSSIVDIAINSINKGGQTLIFAETRKRASSIASKASESVYSLLNKSIREQARNASSQILKKGEDTEQTRLLSYLVSKGVAFHHAGLGLSNRVIVEESFKKGTIKLLVATSTLAAGVNLPARCVILTSYLRYDPEYGGNIPISILEYKQLCGRAGRPKYDVVGESIMISESKTNTRDLYQHYINGVPEPIRSRMANERSIRAHLLSTIATVPGMKKSEVYDLFGNTLFAQQYGKSTVYFKVDVALNYLEDEDLIKSKNNRYIATEFGRHTSLLYIDPTTAVEFRRSINSIKRSMGRVTHTLGFLHLITSSEDFYPKYSLRKKDFEELNVIIQQHINELFYQISEYDCSRSFWSLYEWINETSDRVLSDKIGIEPGDMHRMVEISDWLIHSLYEIAKLLKREDLLEEIYNLRIRLKYGIREELLPLVALESIGRVRARALYEAGITDVMKIANASEAKLSVISKIGPALAKKLKGKLKR